MANIVREFASRELVRATLCATPATCATIGTPTHLPWFAQTLCVHSATHL